MKVGFIGAGKVGVTLGKYFCQHQLEVTGYYSRSIQSAVEAAGFTATNIYAAASDLLAESDVLFFTVPDDAIMPCYEALRQEVGTIRGKIFCHASGAMTAEAAFPGIEATGAFGYSVHPLFAISDRFNVYSELTDVFFTLEGSVARRDFMLEWLRGTGLRIQLIEAGCKPQEARAILPLDCNTELVHTAFISDWKHFFDLRALGTTGAPHPDAKVLALPLMEEFKKKGYLKSEG